MAVGLTVNGDAIAVVNVEFENHLMVVPLAQLADRLVDVPEHIEGDTTAVGAEGVAVTVIVIGVEAALVQFVVLLRQVSV